jgi:hypothetical protein
MIVKESGRRSPAVHSQPSQAITHRIPPGHRPAGNTKPELRNPRLTLYSQFRY